MTKAEKRRFAKLERRVKELEARPIIFQPIVVPPAQPYYPPPAPAEPPCPPYWQPLPIPYFQTATPLRLKCSPFLTFGESTP